MGLMAFQVKMNGCTDRQADRQTTFGSPSIEDSAVTFSYLIFGFFVCREVHHNTKDTHKSAIQAAAANETNKSKRAEAGGGREGGRKGKRGKKKKSSCFSGRHRVDREWQWEETLW
jgi:hypothetical protein